jgi:hypothetical protein
MICSSFFSMLNLSGERHRSVTLGLRHSELDCATQRASDAGLKCNARSLIDCNKRFPSAAATN